ncbi:MAG: amidohydrolase family protein [Pseudomonadota bacterium]
MKKIILAAMIVGASSVQALTPKPAPSQPGPIAIVGATIHVGNGSVVKDATIAFSDGKITAVGAGIDTAGHTVIDAEGHHVYPGFVLPDSDLGLNEVGAVRATVDDTETGNLNPSVRSLVAYNTDSELIPTLRFNGVLIAQVSPGGGIVSGRSSIVQLDAWNWEDAAVVADDGLFLTWPAKMVGRFDWSTFEFSFQENKNYRSQVNAIEQAFLDARAYIAAGDDAQPNVKLEAMRGLFDGSMSLFVRTNDPVDMVRAAEFARGQGVDRVVILGEDGLLDAAEYLSTNDIPVIVGGVHRLPEHDHDRVDAPFRLPGELVAAGVKTGLTYPGENMNGRNLPFIAGTAAAYGLNREQALTMITLTNAEILGIDDRVGSLEVGKHATLFISTGDALDMRGNDVTHAFIDGRKIQLKGMQQELYERFEEKYRDGE